MTEYLKYIQNSNKLLKDLPNIERIYEEIFQELADKDFKIEMRI